jgi:hypothetical protein
MLICPKCQKEFGDGSKICRDCGAILDEAEESLGAESRGTGGVENPQPVVPAESQAISLKAWDDPADSESNAGPWICPKCRESIEANFDVCWSCGTDRQGVEDPDFRAEEDISDFTEHNPTEEFAFQAKSRSSRRAPADPCGKCGSTNVIPDAILGDQGRYSDGKLKVHVMGNPGALIFKDLMRSELRAAICGECGHVELSISNPRALYEHYLRSLDSSELHHDQD